MHSLGEISGFLSDEYEEKISDFKDVAPSCLADIGRRFRGTYCLHHQGVE
jgi:hypothetical protein